MTEKEKQWYIDHIKKNDPKQEFIKLDLEKNLIIYTSKLRTDETHHRSVTPEELVHALILCLLTSSKFNYKVDRIYHEQRIAHGSSGSLSDEIDYMIFDDDNLPYALWEIKSAKDFKSKESETIKYQLFGTAPLTGAPKYLVYATIFPKGTTPQITLKCIDYLECSSHESWLSLEKPFHNRFPIDYQDLNYEPLKKGSPNDLRLDCTQADFRDVAATFHNEFFGEHPDNSLFVNLVKCLLAKIYDERITKNEEGKNIYNFQVFLKRGKPESSQDIFNRVNELYSTAYKRFIDPHATEIDEINPREFAPERVKTVVKVLQFMSLTKGASVHGDIIGAFFEEILRFGFKQDKGMYFTHDNLVTFMLHAVDLPGLTDKIWKNATHPENRLPYVIDPACGSGTFLLKAMNLITANIRSKQEKYNTDLEAEEFMNARLSEAKPNYWAENFIYGMDPKFIMAITAKVNMVLHGDGSAHIFKYDAFKNFNSYDDTKLRITPDDKRSISKAKYPFDVTETFDLLISNPPFGVTLSGETKSKLEKVFSLSKSLPSEALFLERCFQLLKPKGRLAIVLPESVLNASDNIEVRLFLYRLFHIKFLVSLSRNAFKDTPTLTTLVFAQKKSHSEINAWDDEWNKAVEYAEKIIKEAKIFLAESKKSNLLSSFEVKEGFLSILSKIVNRSDWFLKRGKNATVEMIDFNANTLNVEQCITKCQNILKLAGFKQSLFNYYFKTVSAIHNYTFPVYMVDEVGYKLSNRKEKIRPNQLCKFIGINSKQEKPNLHLMDEDFKLVINKKQPERILDFIKRDVKWE